MLDRLVGADRLAEGGALLGVVDRHLHDALRAGRALGRQREQHAVAQPWPQHGVVGRRAARRRRPSGAHRPPARVTSRHGSRSTCTPGWRASTRKKARALPRPAPPPPASRPQRRRSRTTWRRSDARTAPCLRAVASRQGPSIAPLASATATRAWSSRRRRRAAEPSSVPSEPPFWIAQAPNSVPRNGLGARVRPISPRIMARSMQERPRPSYASSITSPGQPIAAILLQLAS